jgi:hypothetical protein
VEGWTRERLWEEENDSSLLDCLLTVMYTSNLLFQYYLILRNFVRLKKTKAMVIMGAVLVPGLLIKVP